MFGLDPHHVFSISGGRVIEFDGTVRRDQVIDPAMLPATVQAVARIGASDVLAGTSSGVVFRSSDGNTWSNYGSAFGTATNAISAIWRDGAHIAIAGDIVRYSVTGLMGPFADLGLAGTTSIAGVQGDVYAAGRGIHHTTDPTGVAWTTEVPADLDPQVSFTGVWSAGNGIAVAVSNAGTILRRAATGAWTADAPDTLPANASLLGVWGTAPDNVYVVGNQGLLLRFDGAAWRRIPLATVENLSAVGGTSPSNVFVVGGSGVMFHYDGASWSQVSSPIGGTLRALDVTTQAMVIVGDAGTGDEIFRSCSVTEQRCGDAWDDDCDGAINCADDDCLGSAECAQGGACAPARPLLCNRPTEGATFTGVARVDDLSCLPVATRGTEAVYRFTPTVSGDVTLTLTDPSDTLELAVTPALNGACDLTTCTGGTATLTGREVTLTATAGQTYYVIVDGPLGDGADFSLELGCP